MVWTKEIILDLRTRRYLCRGKLTYCQDVLGLRDIDPIQPGNSLDYPSLCCIVGEAESTRCLRVTKVVHVEDAGYFGGTREDCEQSCRAVRKICHVR